MPNHAHTFVSDRAARLRLREITAMPFPQLVPRRRSSSPQRFLHGRVVRMKLLITGHLLLRYPARVFLENDEMTQQFEKSSPLKNSAQQNFRLRYPRWCNRLALNRSPRHKTFGIRANSTDARLDAVRDNVHRIAHEH